MFEERTYRRQIKPGDLICYGVVHKETDLFCCTSTDLRDYMKERVLFYRNQLETYGQKTPLFLESFVPIREDRFAPPIAAEMIRASATVGVGPMATVAGAIAEFLGRDIAGLSEEFIIENGGDVFMKTDKERLSLVYAGSSPFSGRIGLKLKPRRSPFGLCTSSGTVGHSVSFGRADAVTVLADSSMLGDGVATYLGNIVKKSEDITRAIERGRSFPGVRGLLVIIGDQLGSWGEIEIVKV